MVNAVLRGWEAQRFTVFEQFLVLQRNETGRFNEALNGVTGVAHPIFIHTGGHHRDHAYWNRESMLRMYDQYIVPNNATLALVGAMKMDAVRPLAEKYFGRVSRAPEPPYRMDVEAEPPPGGTVRLDWLEPLDPQLIVRYRIPSVGHPDRPAFDIIARVLRGPDGVLAAVQKGGPDWQANASQNGSPNTFSMSARPGRDEDFPVLERTTAMAVDRLKREPVDDAQLARIRRELAFEWDLLRSERGGLASQLANYSTIDEWRTMRTYLEARNNTTAADIQRVAAKYFVPWNQIIATTRRNPQTPARDNLTGPRGSKRSQGSGGSGGSGGSRGSGCAMIARVMTVALALLLLSAAQGCGRGAAQSADTLPGRTRPVLEHNWAHPRSLKFPANAFRPPDVKATLLTTASGLRASSCRPRGPRGADHGSAANRAWVGANQRDWQLGAALAPCAAGDRRASRRSFPRTPSGRTGNGRDTHYARGAAGRVASGVDGAR
jgi:hypothetical protein